MQPAPKRTLRVAVALIGIMIAIFILSVVFFYFIAFRDLSPRQMSLTGVLFLLTAVPLMGLAIKICLPYRR